MHLQKETFSKESRGRSEVAWDGSEDTNREREHSQQIHQSTSSNTRWDCNRWSFYYNIFIYLDNLINRLVCKMSENDLKKTVYNVLKPWETGNHFSEAENNFKDWQIIKNIQRFIFKVSSKNHIFSFFPACYQSCLLWSFWALAIYSYHNNIYC